MDGTGTLAAVDPVADPSGSGFDRQTTDWTLKLTSYTTISEVIHYLRVAVFENDVVTRLFSLCAESKMCSACASERGRQSRPQASRALPATPGVWQRNP